MAELRMSLRRLRRRPGRSVIGVVTLALGIGSATAAFSVVDGVLLEPLFDGQDRIVVGWYEAPERGFAHVPFDPAMIERIAREADALERVGAFETQGPQTTIAEATAGPFGLERTRVVADFFGALGARPAVGRLLTPSDDAPGAEPVAVIGYDLWQRLWAGDPGAVGDVLDFDRRSFRVVGVAEEEVAFPSGTEVWTTYRGSVAEWSDDQIAEVDLVGRLRDGASVPDAGASVYSVLSADPELSRVFASEPMLRPIGEVVIGTFDTVVWAALGVALLLLVVASANAALLFLTGGARSARELAARRALGATRRQAAAPLLWDSAVQGALAVVAGSALAVIFVRVVVATAPAELPRLESVSVGGWALAFAAAMGALAMTGSGGIAGWWLSRVQARDALATGVRSKGSSGEGVRRAIAATQVALAVVSAIGAGLLVRTVDNLVGLDRGFEPSDLYVVRLDHPHALFAVPEAYVSELEAVAEALGSLVDIRGATPTINAPLDFSSGLEMVPRVEGQSDEDVRTNPYVSIDAVLPGYFDVLGMRVEEGRVFDTGDGPRAERVVVVNRAAARALWPTDDALGGRVDLYPGERGVSGTVVGVVSDSRYRSFPDTRPAAWVPLRQYRSVPPSRMLVRTTRPDVPVRDLVAQTLAARAPGVRVVSVDSMEDVLRRPLLVPRFARVVLLALASVSLMLTGLGVYGVFSMLVQERAAELGLRRAMGARATDLASFVLRRVLVVGGVGAAGGVVLTLWLAGPLEAVLYGVDTWDPFTLGAVVCTVLAGALLAAGAPAVRAARADPARALRTD